MLRRCIETICRINCTHRTAASCLLAGVCDFTFQQILVLSLHKHNIHIFTRFRERIQARIRIPRFYFRIPCMCLLRLLKISLLAEVSHISYLYQTFSVLTALTNNNNSNNNNNKLHKHMHYKIKISDIRV